MHHRHFSLLYGLVMSATRPSTVSTLATNLRELMRETGMSARAVSSKSGVSLRMINYILIGERKATLDVADRIAAVFGINGWQIIKPELKIDLARSGRLSKLVEHYESASEEGRQYLDRVAEREGKYRSGR